MWKLTENKTADTEQELKVKALLREMSDSYAETAGEFENHFKQLVKDIPRSNNYSADLLYKLTPRNQKSVEVWKMTPKGDYKYKMFTLEYLN